MQMQPSNSSMIEAHGYDEPTQTLALKFRKGATYHYHGMLPHEYQAFATADSHGKHFSAHVKGKFPEKRVHG